MSLSTIAGALASTTAIARNQPNSQTNQANNNQSKDLSFANLLSQLLDGENKHKHQSTLSSLLGNTPASTDTQSDSAVAAASSSSGVNISA